MLTHEGQPTEEASIIDCDEFVLLSMNWSEAGEEYLVSAHMSDPSRPALLFYGMRTLAVGLQMLPTKGAGQFKLVGDMVVKVIHKGMEQLKQQVDKYKLEP